MSKLIQRFLLVSDMHYTTEQTAEELKLTHPEARTCPASGRAFGKKQSEKIAKVYDDICEEHRRSPLDAVLVLGDLSVDDYDFRRLPDNYCRRFKNECMDRLPIPAYAIPGNHDSYPEALWREVFGYGRQYTLELGDSVFIMADTFASTPASKTDPGSGSPHTEIDERFLEQSLKDYAGKRIFLCAHYFEKTKTFSDTAKRLIKDNPDIVCLFRGHTHVASLTNLGEELGGKPLVDIGGYGYCGKKIDGRWEFNIFDRAWSWGFQMLEIYDDRIRTYHTRSANKYLALNGEFDIRETLELDTNIG